ncbi:MAG: hypothetical protein ACXWQQ_15490, partial [Pseudobdellovibrio sp.]
MLWSTAVVSFAAEEEKSDSPKSRVASILISEDFLNEQLAAHLAKSQLIKELKIDLNKESDKMYMRGLLQLPLDDFRAVGIDPHMAEFKFQLTIKPQINEHGFLVLEFPLSETFFYQANSKNPQRDRVIIPTQLLSLGLASTRGYLAAMSGDFSFFDRKSAKITALIHGIKRSIKEEKNPDALAALKTEQKSLELQLESNAVEREQFERTSKTISNIMGVTGEKEFNLNNEIQAKDNAIMLKLKLSHLVPYLKDVDVGGVRIVHNKNAGKSGEDYFVVDVNSTLTEQPQQATKAPRPPAAPIKIAPSILVRMNQSIFTSKTVIDAEKSKMGSDIQDFEILFKEDGIHVSGKIHKYFISIPFDTTVDFITTAPDIFEVRLRQLNVL